MDAIKAEKMLTSLTDGAKAGRVSRRQFMEGAAAAGLTVAAASTMWAKDVKAATPQKGGHYTVGLHDGNTSDSHDPGTYQSVGQIQLAHTTQNWLTEQLPNGDIVGEIAESWDASADAKTWSFKIRKGVEFHNGKTLTPADVAASLNYHRGEDSKSAAKAQLEAVTDVKVDGDNVVLTCNTGFADLPYTLTDYHLVMLPEKDGSIAWEGGIGTGAYKIDTHDAGVSTQMTKNPNYFKEDKGWFDSVDFTVINDPNARVTAIKTGAVDAITNIDLKTVSLIKRDPKITVDNIPSGAHVTIPMFCDFAPFDNVDVRLALKYGFPRDEAIQKIMKGFASKGNDHPIGASVPYHAGDLEQREYDPDKAKFHLKKAGMENVSVELSAGEAAYAGAVDTAIIFKEGASKGGIEINVVREPSDGYWSNVWLVKPFVMVQWGQRPTPDVMFSLAYAAEADWNESHWKNARFNELLAAAKGELDQTKRAEQYREMQVLCRDDGGTIVPWFTNRVNVFQNYIQHSGEVSGIWELDGGRSTERWWRTS